MQATAVTPPPTFSDYLAAWNAREPRAVRPLLEASVHPDVEFVDPNSTVTGIDELEQLILTARRDFPEATYSVTSGIDGQKGRYRYDWATTFGNGVVVPGADVTHVDADGRITRIDGFFGTLPPLAG